jgi:hypothetical protein
MITQYELLCNGTEVSALFPINCTATVYKETLEPSSA